MRARPWAFTASTSGPYGVNGNNSGLNIGNLFTVSGTNILVSSLGAYDYAGNGLASAHTVSLFVQVGTAYAPALRRFRSRCQPGTNATF